MEHRFYADLKGRKKEINLCQPLSQQSLSCFDFIIDSTGLKFSVFYDILLLKFLTFYKCKQYI